MDHWRLYRWMLRSRLVEEAVAELWREGWISGEMHLGTGEEAIIAGVVDHLEPRDALSLDHRGTAPAVMRGVPLRPLLLEILGQDGGLSNGKAGHMHLFSREHNLVSSGIVGAGGPAAAGFGLAAVRKRAGGVAVAFFGEAALNQGMMMEALNLAAAWHLPVLFVCKDDSWGITTDSAEVTGGSVRSRAQGLGLEAVTVDGRDVAEVWAVASQLVADCRAGNGPSLLHATCVHLESHFLGYPIDRLRRDPLGEGPAMVGPVLRSFLQPRGGSLRARIAGMTDLTGAIWAAFREGAEKKEHDPLLLARQGLMASKDRLAQLEREIGDEVIGTVSGVLAELAA